MPLGGRRAGLSGAASVGGWRLAISCVTGSFRIMQLRQFSLFFQLSRSLSHVLPESNGNPLLDCLKHDCSVLICEMCS
jgi:hypothetical protein